jgi:hypothetical protein
MFDVKKLTLRIALGRGEADDLYGLRMHSFQTWKSMIMSYFH